MALRMGSTEWEAMVNESNIRNAIDGLTNFTLFVPTNQAMQVNQRVYIPHLYKRHVTLLCRM